MRDFGFLVLGAVVGAIFGGFIARAYMVPNPPLTFVQRDAQATFSIGHGIVVAECQEGQDGQASTRTMTCLCSDGRCREAEAIQQSSTKPGSPNIANVNGSVDIKIGGTDVEVKCDEHNCPQNR